MLHAVHGVAKSRTRLSNWTTRRLSWLELYSECWSGSKADLLLVFKRPLKCTVRQNSVGLSNSPFLERSRTGGGILVGGHARKWPTQVWSSQGIAGHGKQWGRAGTSWFTSLWVEAIPQPRPAASAAPAVVWLSDTITYTSRPCSLPSAAGSNFVSQEGWESGRGGPQCRRRVSLSTVCSRKAESRITCKYGLSAETFWERKEISWVSVYFLGCKRQMDKINETKSIPSSNTMMFPFLLMIDLSFSETKHSVNLFKPSLSWTQGYKASLWEALSLAVWIAVASPSGFSPSGSRVRSVSPPGNSAMDAHHITSSIFTQSPRTGHLSHLPLSLFPHHAGCLTVQQKGPDVNSSEYLGVRLLFLGNLSFLLA